MDGGYRPHRRSPLTRSHLHRIQEDSMATPAVRDIVSIDPRTGEAVEVVTQETTSAEVDRLWSVGPLNGHA